MGCKSVLEERKEGKQILKQASWKRFQIDCISRIMHVCGNPGTLGRNREYRNKTKGKRRPLEDCEELPRHSPDKPYKSTTMSRHSVKEELRLPELSSK